MTTMWLLALLAAPQDDEVTVRSLLAETTDLDRLTRPASYSCRQFSSYDRASHRPEEWFANGDCGQYLRREGEWFVLAEADGPGAIVRLWSANPAGTLRILLDGSVALEEDFAALLTGKVKPFEPPYGALRSLGANLYFPFPYAKSMKVVCSKGGQYYHVNYRTWPKSVRVRTFSRDQIGELPRLEIAPQGESTAQTELAGPGVVRRIEIRLPEDPTELRRKTLRIAVDGEICVWSPLGDFFGTAPGRTAYDGLPLGITKEGVGYCNFPMPFERSFKIETDGAPVSMRVTRDSRPFRFHAWWRGTNSLKTRPMSDWPVLRGEGRGRYVGTFLAVRNPVKAWWGEGDEKVYVDGETFPSTFGTGTEDYFGYAWCCPTPFQAPYHNETRCDGPANRGQTAVARYHILDDIPFTKSIRFDLEVWHWADTTIGYSTVAYWYAEPGFKHDFKPAADADREIVEVPRVPTVAGAIEGEKMKVLEAAGKAEVQDLSWADGFSGDAHLWWRETKPGDVLRVEFESPVEGKRTLILALTKARDYGIVKISVNGRLLADSIDLYDPNVVPAGEREFKDVPLRKGANQIRVEVVGTNPKAKPANYMFGLDYVRIP